ncbi:MAG: hypothetical protein WBS14_13200 [Rhodomicrobium sp.]|jgi:hypothetical protein
MTGQPDIDAFVAAFKAEIVDLYKDSGSNFVADGGDYLTIEATIWNDDLRDLFRRVFARLSTPPNER